MKRFLLIALLFGCELANHDLDEKTGASVQPTIYFTMDEQIAQIGDEIEGFGGYYFNDDGSIEVFIKEESFSDINSEQTNIITDKISKVHPNIINKLKAKTGSLNVNFKKAQFSFEELNYWRNLIREYASKVENLSMIDIDEMKNRIVIGVSSDVIDSTEIGNFLEDLKIPRKSIEIVTKDIPELNPQSIDCFIQYKTEEVDPQCGIGGGDTNPSGGTNNLSLDDQHSNYVGGIKIANDMGGACTLGLNVSWDNDTRLGFVTASHCTEDTAEYDGGEWYQYSKNSTKIGEEAVDRLAFDYTSSPSCPSEHNNQDVLCRYSDVALIEYTPNSKNQAELGYVANPISLNSNIISSNSDLYGYEIMGASNWPYSNMNIHKIGFKSGLTNGVITRSCVDAYFNRDGKLYFFICVAEADYDSEPGDSGAPILVSSNNYWNSYGFLDFEALLVGFHIGAAGPDYAYFSSAYYTIGTIWNNSGGRCNYANWNGGNWLNSELCDEPFYGPFEIRAVGNR